MAVISFFESIILSLINLFSPSLCPNGFISVPANHEYVEKDFCISKYEMKLVNNKLFSIPEGVPHSDISRNKAIMLCKSLGAKYNLIGNNEYQNVARNLESVSANWSSGLVGVGKINRGLSNDANEESQASDDSNPCFMTNFSCKKNEWNLYKRTHRLTNGELIWDFSGNAWQYIRENYSELKLETDIPYGRYDFNDPSLFPPNGTGRNRYLFAPKTINMKRENGVGHIGTAEFDRKKYKFDEVVVRGGHHDSGEKAGIFTFLRTPVHPDLSDIGAIRCVYYP